MTQAYKPYHKFDQWLNDAWLFESEWRKDNETNFDYYYGDQFTAEEKAILAARHQPLCTLNYVRPLVDMILAMEKERKIDMRVVGRESSDDQMSDLLTNLMKQVSDETSEEFFTSDSFRDMVIGGRGIIYVEPKEEKTYFHSNEKEPGWFIDSKHIPWEEVYIDPYYRKPDASDARYIIRCVWVDRDIAAKKYGKEKIDMIIAPDNYHMDDFEGIEAFANYETSNRLGYYDKKTDRVMLSECQYRNDEGKICYCIFAGPVMLYGSHESDEANKPPFKTNGYWIIPMTAFRDRKGVPRGIVKMIREMQDMLNKENSKLVWNMMSNRMLIEEGATEDYEQLRNEWNRPDGVVHLNEGGLMRVKSQDNLVESQHLMQHMGFILDMMQRTSGVNDSMLGFGGVNERSAAQQNTRILQGSQVQSEIMEHMLYARLIHAKRKLFFIGCYYTQEKIVRITQPNGTTERMVLNERVPDETGENYTFRNKINDILEYDVVFKAEPLHTTTRQLQLQMFSEIAKSIALPPELVWETWISLSDMPNKEDVILKGQQLMAQQQAQQNAVAAEQAMQAQAGM